ncbi:MAG: 4Fe-4S binding protein [Acidiferrobacterales bacterium]
MSVVTEQVASGSVRGDRLARLGIFMRRHQALIVAAQWVVVLGYTVLLIVPVFLPLPANDARIVGNFTRFAQFVFWGIWWPFVIVSIMAFGRAWCGLLCPEGTLTEWVSQYGLGLGIPRWMKWAGWPFVTFMVIALYGQMISLHWYSQPTLLILGGSTVAAIAVGLCYGRGKRVWCRHLCPVCGVFALLAKVAPVHFGVDQTAWDAAPAGSRTSLQHSVNCAPLINIRRMESASECHMCGRCADERRAVQLALRAPSTEILASSALDTGHLVDAPTRWLSRLLVFGMVGAALGAFQWGVSPWFSATRQAAAQWLVAQHILWPLGSPGHWWLLTDYPAAGSVFTWLDGGMLMAYIGVEALVLGTWIIGWMRLAGAAAGLSWQRVAEVLIFFAGINLFVGSGLLAVSQDGAKAEWIMPAAMALLVLSAVWGVVLAWRMAPRRRAITALASLIAVVLPLAAWATEFFVWRPF